MGKSNKISARGGKKTNRNSQRSRIKSTRKKIFFASALAFFLLFGFVNAQVSTTKQTPVVNYNGQEPIDSDLDGLTDQAEVQVYKTDPNNADTDGDGYYDGTEVLAGSNPLDPTSTPITVNNKSQAQINAAASAQSETPWAWYISRVSGLVAFALLYISIFLALTIRLPFLRKIFAPAYALNAHCWIALQATIFVFLHGFVLIFDKFLNFSLKGVFVPFASAYEPLLVALGTIGFYLMILLVITSYGRKYLSYKMWRTIHFFNIGLYFIVVIHALYLGTDLKIPLVQDIFIAANEFLVVLMLINMFLQIKTNIARKKQAADFNDDIDLIK